VALRVEFLHDAYVRDWIQRGDDVEKLSKPGRFDEPVLIIRANLEKEKVFGYEVLLFDPKGARQRAADIAQGKSEEKEMDKMRDRRATEGLKLR